MENNRNNGWPEEWMDEDCCDIEVSDNEIICDLCREVVFEDDSYGGVCLNCLDENTTFENALEFGDVNQYDIKINGFLASVFTDKEIEEILKKKYKEHMDLFNSKSQEEIENFCFEDRWDFGHFLRGE